MHACLVEPKTTKKSYINNQNCKQLIDLSNEQLKTANQTTDQDQLNKYQEIIFIPNSSIWLDSSQSP